MKVLIADKMSTTAMHELEKLECEVTFSPDLSADDLPDQITDHEILVVRSTKVTSDTINTADALSLIIRAGAGVNTIDLEAASKRGVYVANCPGQNTQAVAELVIGLLIAVDRRIANAAQDLRDGKWKKKEYSNAAGLAGRTLGIIGLGAIGRAVAMAAKGLKMEVVAWSRGFTPEEARHLDIGYCESPLEAAQRSDAVTVHVAATPETENMINADFFRSMKDGSIFINTSRGSVVNDAALKNAITQKGLRVALDVWPEEPGSGSADFEDTELAAQITGTPHIGASTNQAAEAIAATVVDIVEQYLKTGTPLNAVNVRGESKGVTTLIVTHYNKVGVLAGVLSEIRNQGINIEEMSNTIFEHAAAASATIKIDGWPPQELLQHIRGMDHIIHVLEK